MAHKLRFFFISIISTALLTQSLVVHANENEEDSEEQTFIEIGSDLLIFDNFIDSAHLNNEQVELGDKLEIYLDPEEVINAEILEEMINIEELDQDINFENEIDFDIDSSEIVNDPGLGMASEPGKPFQVTNNSGTYRAIVHRDQSGNPEKVELLELRRGGEKHNIPPGTFLLPDGSMIINGERVTLPTEKERKDSQLGFKIVVNAEPTEEDDEEEEPAGECDPSIQSCPAEEPAECDPSTQSCPDAPCDPETTSCPGEDPEDEPEGDPVSECLDMAGENCDDGESMPEHIASGHNIDGNNNDTPADDGSQECDYRNDNNCNNGEITVGEDPILGLDDGDQCDERIAGNDCVGEQVREANEADFRNNSIGPDPDDLM